MPSRASCVAVALACLAAMFAAAPAHASRASKQDPSEATAKELFVRTTKDGIRVRAHDAIGILRNEPYPENLGTTGGPIRCGSIGTLLVGLSTDTAVGQGAGSLLHPREKPALVFVASGGFGVAQGEPVAWVGVQASKRVVSVRAEFVGNGADEMRPVHGVAVLAAEVSGSVAQNVASSGPYGRVQALDADGHVIATIKVGPTQSYETGIPEDCKTPTLEQDFPEATGPPPADEEAARAAVTAAYDTAYDPGPTREEKLAAIEDGTKLASAYDRGVAANPQYNGQVSIRVDEVRFVDRRNAAVRFALNAAGTDVLSGQIGRAKLVDGTWVVARDTFCTLLSFGGVDCTESKRADPVPVDTSGLPRLLVLNGSGVSQGAATMANQLRGHGYPIAGTGNAPQAQSGTTVACVPGFEEESAAVAQSAGSDATVVPFPATPPVGAENADCVVIVGS